jgi:hypothetical protein
LAPRSPACQSPRTANGVGFSVEQRPEQAGVVPRVVFQIRVLNDGKLSPRAPQPRANGRPLAPVPGAAQQFNPPGLPPRLKHLEAPVTRTVVRHDDLFRVADAENGLQPAIEFSLESGPRTSRQSRNWLGVASWAVPNLRVCLITSSRGYVA